MVNSEQNTSAKVAKISEPNGNTFQCFRDIVATLGKAVGIREIESVEDIRSPVARHSGACPKFWYSEESLGFQPVMMSPGSNSTVWRGHKWIEHFLEGIGLL